MKFVFSKKFHRQERDLEAFLFSILIHVFIFTSVSFIFYNLQRAPKPAFVFLGPILGYEEIQNLRKPDGPGPVLGNSINLRIQPIRPSAYSVHKTLPEKTLFIAEEPSGGDKTYVKNPFMKEKSRIQIERDQLLKLGIDPDIPRWVPLRLSP